jgi:hypothetical protein
LGDKTVDNLSRSTVDQHFTGVLKISAIQMTQKNVEKIIRLEDFMLEIPCIFESQHRQIRSGIYSL